MKNILNKTYILLFAMIALALNSCVEPDDLITSDAKAGGLVDVLSGNIPFKAGTNPTLEISLEIPVGPGIQSIEVSKSFTTVDGKSSNAVVLSNIDISNANEQAIVEKSFTVDYSSLIADLVLEGNPLPPTDAGLSIGDTWTFVYTSIMADGRRVANNGVTNIGIANPYAGKYHRVGHLLHPSAGDLYYDETGLELNTVDASTVKTLCGYWENPAYILTVKVNADNSVTVGGDVGGSEITGIPGKVNAYDPATKTFTLNYTYNGRLFDETMTAE